MGGIFSGLEEDGGELSAATPGASLVLVVTPGVPEEFGRFLNIDLTSMHIVWQTKGSDALKAFS